MTPFGAALGALFTLAALAVARDDGASGLGVPVDGLPRPLERVELLGVEGLAAGWTATDKQVALGRRLFFDPKLSKGGTVACASCHRPEFAFADNRRYSLGINGQPTLRNSPSLLNKSLSTHVLWDGRAARLEDQVLMPIENPSEMGLGVEPAIEQLAADEVYTNEFEGAFGSAPTAENLASALAAFVRALSVGNSPVDRFEAGEFKALTAQERSGLWLFQGRGGCWRCHKGPNFSDEDFHNTGIGVLDEVAEEGRGAITGEAGDHGKFRTPGLRMLTKTAPYMHDGSQATLEEVVEYYRTGGVANAQLSDKLKPFTLSEADAANLVSFLRALSR
ncbi:MAG: cytochrome c peroxidase [Planctomycetota bacterium]